MQGEILKGIELEIKKSETANPENSRSTGFLLGLIFVLALLFVGFEFNSRSGDAESDSRELDDMAQDIVMRPAMNRQDMIAAMSPSPTSRAITEKIKAVDKVENKPDKVSPNSNPLMIGDGDGQVSDANVTQALPQTPVEDHGLNDVRIVEALPEFPGGMVEFMKWLTKNLRYPTYAHQQRIEGKVVVSFIVNTDGSIAEVKLARSVDPLLDREALRVIRMMPKWKPGIQNNQPCRTMFAVPVVFKL